jgi:hypothetical protein
MEDRNNTYWIVEKIGDDKANLSVCSEEEANAMKKVADDFEDWMIASTQNVSKEEMEDRIEDHGREFDPWA